MLVLGWYEGEEQNERATHTHLNDSMPFKPPVPWGAESDPGTGFTSAVYCVWAAILRIAVPAIRR